MVNTRKHVSEMNNSDWRFGDKFTKKYIFRFRDRYTRAQTSESIDNLSRSVDLRYSGFDLN